VPIRFRCAYCNQLMGISRRKAGTVVRCPTCSGQVVVPNPDDDSPAPPAPGPAPAPPRKGGPDLFEQSDFDDLLRPGGPAAPVVTVPSGGVPPGGLPPSGAWGTHAEPMLNVERAPNAAGVAMVASPPLGVDGAVVPAGGLVLTQRQLAVAAVVGVLLLGLAFVGGVLVGKFVL
jgi:DNA-directed RNA polymerase subunit RPC12/RpoP